MTPLVNTTLGPLPESDLEVKVIPQESDPSCWTVAIEGRYIGNDPAFAEHRGNIIRRDVWVSIKYGHQSAGEQGGM